MFDLLGEYMYYVPGGIHVLPTGEIHVRPTGGIHVQPTGGKSVNVTNLKSASLATPYIAFYPKKER